MIIKVKGSVGGCEVVRYFDGYSTSPKQAKQAVKMFYPGVHNLRLTMEKNGKHPMSFMAGKRG